MSGSSITSPPLVKLRQGLYDVDQSLAKPSSTAGSGDKPDSNKDPLEEMETSISAFLKKEHVGPIMIKSYLKD